MHVILLHGGEPGRKQTNYVGGFKPIILLCGFMPGPLNLFSGLVGGQSIMQSGFNCCLVCMWSGLA